MEFLTIFGVLAQRRALVGLGVLASLLVGAAVAGVLPIGPSSVPPVATGQAQTRVIVDHPTSVVANTGEISDTVGTQAALLADLVTGDAQRDLIAQRAAIPATQLGMQRMQLADVIALGQIPTHAAQASAKIARPYVVNVWPASPLPVLTIDVLAPTAAEAARVARATRDALQAIVQTDALPGQRTIVLRPLGEVRALTIPGSTRSKLIAVAATIACFIFWLCGVVILTGLQRAWRNLTAQPETAAAP